jgi:hypothetical protein
MRKPRVIPQYILDAKERGDVQALSRYGKMGARKKAQMKAQRKPWTPEEIREEQNEIREEILFAGTRQMRIQANEHIIPVSIDD